MEHGTFQQVEGHLERWHEQQKQKAALGGPVTKEWLMETEKWTKCLLLNQILLDVLHGQYSVYLPPGPA